jgi:phosphomethylpyrimidine synthase
MKITQEVRDFAAKQNQGADSFLAATATPSVHPEPVEGLSLIPPANEKGRASTCSARMEEEIAAAGMAVMNERFHEEGGEIYLPFRPSGPTTS